MTLYVVPCGISILDGLSRGRGVPRQGSYVEGLCEAALAFAEKVHTGIYADADVAHRWRSELADQVDEAQLGEWKPEVCAEAYTLACRKLEHGRQLDLARLLAAPGGPASHQVVILASDTTPGLASALLAASRIANGRLNLLRYSSTRDDALRRAVVPGIVTVARIVGLTPNGSPDGILEGAQGLGGALRLAVDAAGGQPVEVHLTGGYKATLLHLLAMTELLHSTESSEVTAWYLYDDDPSRATTIQIGLRRFSRHYTNWVQRELTDVADGRNPPAGDFTQEGSAWVRLNGQPILNGFGRGYLGVLGRARPAPSDDGG